MAAEEGNTYSNLNNRLLTNTLRRACAQSPEKLREMCDVLVDKASQGDLASAAFIFDRLEGKAVQKQETDMAVSGAFDIRNIVINGK